MQTTFNTPIIHIYASTPDTEEEECYKFYGHIQSTVMMKSTEHPCKAYCLWLEIAMAVVCKKMLLDGVA